MNRTSLRILFDVNVLISALVYGGSPRKVVDLVIDGTHVFLTSREIQTQLLNTLEYKKFQARLKSMDVTPKQLVTPVVVASEVVSPATIPANSVRDLKDVMILAAAVGGRADYLVSGDKDLTSIQHFQNVKIVTPAQLLSILIDDQQNEAL